MATLQHFIGGWRGDGAENKDEYGINQEAYKAIKKCCYVLYALKIILLLNEIVCMYIYIYALVGTNKRTLILA